jgi:L-ascorbate metabolism protein UlaG (beta-lactamase superfamily)
MQHQLIRNATQLLTYGGHRLLLDPYFAPQFTRPAYAGKSQNPLVELPITTRQIIEGVQVVILSHLHSDHFDPAAQEALPKSLPILCQPGDDGKVREKGFTDVTPVVDEIMWQGIRITRTGGHHGLGTVEADMGVVSGYVFRADGEPTVYWAGDTVMCDEVRQAISAHKPDIIITHSSGAVWPVGDEKVLIVMDAAQTLDVCRLAPDSTVVAIHLDSLDHGTVTRLDLRAAASAAGISSERLLIPEDGEVTLFSSTG